jgi:hypothetical protein
VKRHRGRWVGLFWMRRVGCEGGERVCLFVYGSKRWLFSQAVDPKRMHGYDIGLSVAGRSMGLNQ